MPIKPENRGRYPADWPAVRARILHRSKDWRPGSMAFVERCECEGECGRGTHDGRCPNLQHGFAYGSGSLVVLTVAHLNHTPEDNRDENLRAMCQGCHLHYDREHHRRSRNESRLRAREAAGQLDMGGGS